MSFGSLLGSATGVGASGGTSISTSTSLTVSVGDLVVVTFNCRASVSPSFSDNLGNTWTNLTNGSGSATEFMNAAFTKVTVAGSMTPKATCTSTSDAICIIAGQYSGPFASSPLDLNPACVSYSVSGTVSGPATGTLAQATELIVSYCSTDVSTVPTAVSPFSLTNNIGGGSGAKQSAGGLESEVVSATTSVTPQWSVSGTAGGIGVATFKAAPAVPFLFRRRLFITG